jgi:hypothetical protein
VGAVRIDPTGNAGFDHPPASTKLNTPSQGGRGGDGEVILTTKTFEITKIGEAEIVYDARKAWPLKYHDQIVHWLAEGIPYHRIESLCRQQEMEVPTRRQLAELTYRNKDEITTIREQWQERMWNEGLANKDHRIMAEIALAEILKDAIWEGGEEHSGRPKYQIRDYINILELIGRETGQIGTSGSGEDRSLKILIQTIVNGTPNAAIEVGTEGRLLSPVGVSTDERKGGSSPLLNEPPISPRRRRRQRKVLPDSQGSGTARSLSAGSEGQ